jgi:hypothetical protein
MRNNLVAITQKHGTSMERACLLANDHWQNGIRNMQTGVSATRKVTLSTRKKKKVEILSGLFQKIP